MATFGAIGSFDPETECWTQYTERLEQFFVANQITDENRKRAIFLTVIGPSTFGLLRNLLSPDSPSSRTLQQLVDSLNEHYDPAPSEIVERFKFNSRIRKTGESVANFIAELRRLAKYCNYGASLDMMLRDRIVCGINDEAIQRKLLAETALTLARASEIAVAMEAAARNAVDLKTVSTSSDVCLVQQKRSSRLGNNIVKPKSLADKGANRKCFRCGDTQHTSAECRFISATCHACHKTGHIARICQSKGKTPRKTDKKRTPNKVNQLQLQTLSTVQNVIDTPKQYEFFNLKVLGVAPPPTRLPVKVEGQEIVMEVDSGAPFSLIPESTYVQYKNTFPQLHQTDIELQTYTQQSIEILGVMTVKVQFRSKELSLPLLVVREGTVNLAGRNWIQPLNLMSVEAGYSTNAVSEGNPGELSLQRILVKHQDVFAQGLGLINTSKVHLTPRPGAQPKFFRARPVPYALREKVNREIDRLLKEGILEPVANSEWATPVVSVLKRDGSVRLCGDFKLTVNQATELEQYPLPKIEDLFAQLSGGETFSKLDLRDAYCQLELDEDSRDLVVINTLRGLFRYTRLPFGIASAPAIFQREMEKILHGLPGASCYLDDLLVSGRSKAEHLQNLDLVLSKLQEAGIKLHSSKCEFLNTSVEYLGHRIDKEGLHPVKSKLEAIENAPSPSNVEELRSFIGLLTYYAKFLPKMSTILAPLYRLLEHQQPWKWSALEEKAFQYAKKSLTSSSLLVHFDNSREVILQCDASPYGVGAVLSHKFEDDDRPIAFASRSLTKAEKNYSHIEKETLALVFGVTRFRNYLLGRRFTLVTDHRPLVSLLAEAKPVPLVAAARIQRWALTLSAYAYHIQFRKGTANSNADACSRLPLATKFADPPLPAETILLLQQVDDSPITACHIAKEIDSSSVLSKVRQFIKHGWPKKVPPDIHKFWLLREELSTEKGLILRGPRLFIPMIFRKFVQDELHSGHQGISAIKAMARSSVWWPGIDGDLEQKVKNCVSCQLNASMPPSKQVSWPVPAKTWERVHIDHAGPVDQHMLLIVVDASSKWLEVIPVASTSASATITALRSLFAQFGLPKSVVSDNGPAFSSSEFHSFLANNGVVHIKTAPYHPNSNGIAERAVRTVKEGLKKNMQGTFLQRLARFLFSYRRTPVAATGVSPAIAMFGRPLRSRLDLLREGEEVDRAHRSVSVKKGDLVWIRSFGRGPRWVTGTVEELLGKVMVRVQTTSGVVVRHVDQIRKRQQQTTVAIPQTLESDMAIPPKVLPKSCPTLDTNADCSTLDVDINADRSTLDVNADDNTPPMSSPQPPRQVVKDTGNMDPPHLTPQGKVQGPVDPVQTAQAQASVRRSSRLRRPPRRLEL